MKKYLAPLAGLLALASGGSSEPLLQKLEPVDFGSIVCGCTFNQSRMGVDEGDYGSGPLILVIDPNGSPLNARVNLGNGNVHLEPDPGNSFAMYDCQAGREWQTAWRGSGIRLRVRLTANDEGNEACFFTGDVSAERDERTWSAPVKGACGC